MASTRVFATGATRNDDSERIDPEGFLSPKVMAEFFAYMHKNRFRSNGEIRASDNWQLGITQQAYAKSLSRHYWEFFDAHRSQGNHQDEPSPYRNQHLIDLCCAGMFNFMGYMFEELKKPTRQEPTVSEDDLKRMFQRTQLLEDSYRDQGDEDEGYGAGV